MNPLDCSTADSPKSLQSHLRRSERKIAISRVRHIGLELTKLDKEERSTEREWRSLDTITDPVDRIDSRLKLSKVLDTIRERRRILLGEPLPGSRRSGTERRPILPMQVVDCEPAESISIPEHVGQQSQSTEHNVHCANDTANAAEPTPEPTPSPE